MSVEFRKIYKFKELEEFVSQVEQQPEWKDFMTIRESVQRVISIRGRLLGEKHTDVNDLLYDLNSYRQLDLGEDRIIPALQTAVTVEGIYYEYAQRLGIYFAKEYGNYERIPEYKDMAKEIVAWNLWYRWKPSDDVVPNGLHYSIVGSLKYIPHITYRAFLQKEPFSELSEGTEDSGNRIDFNKSVKDMPIYRLRRAVSDLTLKEIFMGMEKISPRRRLPILCVMGYIPGVKNMTQGVKKFKIETETFRNLFDDGLDDIKSSFQKEPHVSAKDMVEDTLSRAIIRDPNGTLTPFHSPRLILLDHEEPPPGMGDVNEKIFCLAGELNGDTFCHNLTEIGNAVGGLTKTSVAKRIRRIADTYTS